MCSSRSCVVLLPRSRRCVRRCDRLKNKYRMKIQPIPSQMVPPNLLLIDDDSRCLGSRTFRKASQKLTRGGGVAATKVMLDSMVFTSPGPSRPSLNTSNSFPFLGARLVTIDDRSPALHMQSVAALLVTSPSGVEVSSKANLQRLQPRSTATSLAPVIILMRCSSG